MLIFHPAKKTKTITITCPVELEDSFQECYRNDIKSQLKCYIAEVATSAFSKTLTDDKYKKVEEFKKDISPHITVE